MSMKNHWAKLQWLTSCCFQDIVAYTSFFSHSALKAYRERQYIFVNWNSGLCLKPTCMTIQLHQALKPAPISPATPPSLSLPSSSRYLDWLRSPWEPIDFLSPNPTCCGRCGVAVICDNPWQQSNGHLAWWAEPVSGTRAALHTGPSQLDLTRIKRTKSRPWSTITKSEVHAAFKGNSTQSLVCDEFIIITHTSGLYKQHSISIYIIRTG